MSPVTVVGPELVIEVPASTANEVALPRSTVAVAATANCALKAAKVMNATAATVAARRGRPCIRCECESRFGLLTLNERTTGSSPFRLRPADMNAFPKIVMVGHRE